MKTYQKNKKGNNKAFSLIETLVAVMIFSVAVMAVMGVLANGVSNINSVKKKMVASYLAQQGIEYVRNTRDTDIISATTALDGWGKFNGDLLNNSCMDVCPLSVWAEVNGLNYVPVSGFDTSITAKSTSADSLRIISTVSWKEGGKTQSVSFSEILYNWIQ